MVKTCVRLSSQLTFEPWLRSLSWVKFALTVPLSMQLYNWVPRNSMPRNSSPNDELGNWCLTGRQGAWALQAQQGGIHGNPVSGNHPCMQLPPGTVTLTRDQWKILTIPYTYLNPRIKRVGGLGARIRNDSQKVSYSKLVSSQRSTKISLKGKWSAKISRKVTWSECMPRGMLQTPRGPPAGHVH